MTVALTPRLTAQLRAVFGDCIPKDNAPVLLDASPQLPTSPAELQALRAAALELAGQKLAEVEARLGNAGTPSSVTTTSSRPTPAGTALQLQQLQRVRELRTPDGLKKVFSEKEARALFDVVKSMKDVPHDFLEEGCVHRSHVVCSRLEDRGVFTEKVFTIPRGGDLVMTTDKAKLGFTVVWYHEAACIHVEVDDGKGGKAIERRMLDPSVADEPISVERWLATMSGTGGVPLETFVLPRFAYGLQDRDAPPSTWRPDDLQAALRWNTEWREAQQALEESGFYQQLPELRG